MCIFIPNEILNFLKWETRSGEYLLYNKPETLALGGTGLVASRMLRLFCPRDLLLRYLWCSLAGFFWCFCSKPAVMTIRIARQKMHYNRVRFAKRYLFLYSRAYRYGRSLWSPSLCIGSDFGRAVPDYILSGCGLEVYRHLVPFVHLSVRGIGNRFVRKVRESLSGRVFCCLLQYMESCSSLCFFDKQK